MKATCNIHLEMLESIRHTKYPEVWDKRPDHSMNERDARHILHFALEYKYMDIVEKVLDWFEIERSNLSLKERLVLFELIE